MIPQSNVFIPGTEMVSKNLRKSVFGKVAVKS